MNWLKNFQKKRNRVRQSSEIGSIQGNHNEFESHGPLRIHVHRAIGGMVIQTNNYDEKQDKLHQNLYVIQSHQNLAEELSKIITIETIKF
jgi:hypothetical protein